MSTHFHLNPVVFNLERSSQWFASFDPISVYFAYLKTGPLSTKTDSSDSFGYKNIKILNQKNKEKTGPL